MKTNKIKFTGIITVLVLFLGFSGCSKDNTGNTNTPSTPIANEIVIQGMTFNPSSLTVAVGTKVTWRNLDSVSHTVTSDSNLFDSGNMGNNASYSYTFTAAGTYSYHCRIHPSMTATVIVQ
jgi:plastocyanin